MKKYLTATFAIILSLSLTACGNTTTPETKAMSASPSATASSTLSTQEDAAKKAEDEARKKAEEELKAQQEAEAKAKAEKEAVEKIKASKEFPAMVMDLLIPELTGDGGLQEVTRQFIIKNTKWFPAKTDADKKAARVAVDSKVTSRHLFKNVVPHLDKMVKVSGYVVQVQEENTDSGIISTIHIMDDNEYSIIGVYIGSTGDLLDGDYVTLYGVPSAAYSFDNIGGGTTNAILLALSEFKKQVI